MKTQPWLKGKAFTAKQWKIAHPIEDDEEDADPEVGGGEGGEGEDSHAKKLCCSNNHRGLSALTSKQPIVS